MKLQELQEKAGITCKEQTITIKKDFKKVKQIIEKLIVHFGKPKYWVELGGIFSELEQDEKIHQTYYVANLVKGLTNQARKTALAYMNVSAGAYCPAAKVIEEGLKEELIEPDLKNLSYFIQCLSAVFSI